MQKGVENETSALGRFYGSNWGSILCSTIEYVRKEIRDVLQWGLFYLLEDCGYE